MSTNSITLVGAGLVGSLLALFLARRGLSVRVLERRADMRKEAISAGRSINLAISERGINALRKLGIAQEVLGHAVPMKGRMIHSLKGELTFQPYGTHESDYINSISRATLNKILMTKAEETGVVNFHFHKRVTGMDLDHGKIYVVDEKSEKFDQEDVGVLIGTDGSASAIRADMQKVDGFKFQSSNLDYGYKELVIPAKPDGGFKMERNALHIWPRGRHMLIALPNFEGSFTCTLFLPFSGDVSFDALKTDQIVEGFFRGDFGDAVPLIDNLVETFRQNPMGHMTTIKSRRWNIGGKVLLMGDAAHGIVPFFGQGMNCGFEDCRILDELLEQQPSSRNPDWETVFNSMTKMRPPNTDAIADMAVENFIEMRDRVGDKFFLLQKQVEKILTNKFPGRYVSRYALVTFSNVPYKLAMDAGIVQEQILKELCFGLSDPDAVDLSKAEKLIDQKLAPMLKPYAKLIDAVPAH